MKACPKCGSLCTIPIAYGKPTHELSRAAERGLVELGGCVVDEGQPHQRCLDCGLGWRAEQSETGDGELHRMRSMLRDGVMLMHKHRHSLAHRIHAYGAACVAYGRVISQKTDPHQAYVFMLQENNEIEHVWQAFFLNIEEWASTNYFNGEHLGSNRYFV